MAASNLIGCRHIRYIPRSVWFKFTKLFYMLYWTFHTLDLAFKSPFYIVSSLYSLDNTSL